MTTFFSIIQSITTYNKGSAIIFLRVQSVFYSPNYMVHSSKFSRLKESVLKIYLLPLFQNRNLQFPLKHHKSYCRFCSLLQDFKESRGHIRVQLQSNSSYTPSSLCKKEAFPQASPMPLGALQYSN